MRRFVLTTMVTLLVLGPASGWAQTPSGDKMKDDKMEKSGGTMMEKKGGKMDGKTDKGGMKKDMGKMKDDKMEKMDKMDKMDKK